MATLYENYITGDDSNYGLLMTSPPYQWGAQTFTPSVSHIISKVKVKLLRSSAAATPGTITCSLKATDGDDKPTESALATGTVNGDDITYLGDGEWITISFSSSYPLEAGTVYAIELKTSSDNLFHTTQWRFDTNGATYAGGKAYRTSDGGATYVLIGGGDEDFMFEEWGSSGSYAGGVISTYPVADIDKTTATGHGNVISIGEPDATQHGHCWATIPNPTISDSKTENGAPSTGAFTSSITVLEQNTLYYCRAYITNSVGTFYGIQVSFTTTSDVPVLTTDQVTDVVPTTALGHGSIGNNGGSAISQHGVCWSTSANPTIGDSKTEEGSTSTMGDFSSLMTDLVAETTYHVRAYATNASGTGYGADVTFVTPAILTPLVTTQDTTSVETTSATGNGTIVSIGGAQVTQHGHCWSTSANPTTADSKTENGTASSGAFVSLITNLIAGTTYYIRPYATNSYGTSYGDNDTINEVAGELKGNLRTLKRYLAYTDDYGDPRILLGVKI